MPTIQLLKTGNPRDYRPYVPTKEIQRTEHLETMNCTNYGTLNGVETIHKVKYNEEVNYSERFLGVLSGTTRNGNSVHKVCETFRTNGAIDEKLLPFSDNIRTWSQYYSPNPMTENLLKGGRIWLSNNVFQHKWLFAGQYVPSLAQKEKILYDNLLFGPIGISVKAWKKRNGRYYKANNEGDNHWCLLVFAEWGKYWVVYDSYDQVFKELEWDYNFGFAKLFHYEKLNINIQPIMDIKLYKHPNNTTVYAKGNGMGDGLFHPIANEDFVKMFSDGWGKVEVIQLEQEPAPMTIGATIGSFPWFANFISNLFNK